jgi:hypothetical protein
MGPIQKRSFLQQPSAPLLREAGERPQPVSAINVAQPGLSQGSATVIAMGHRLGYARVSTTDQQPHLQVDALGASVEAAAAAEQAYAFAYPTSPQVCWQVKSLLVLSCVG